jgi:hypothetical protein
VIHISSFVPSPGSQVTMLGVKESLAWETSGPGFVVHVPASVRAHPPCNHAWAIRFRVE